MTSIVNDNFGFYAILTNPIRGYEYLTHVLVDNNIAFAQLRIKDEKEYKILRIAEKLRYITEKTNTKLIINDFPNIAKDCEADGVHVGQDDMDFEAVKEIMGNDKIIGISTHNIEQTEKACELKPDYIGVGPVYSTPTKNIPDPVIGFDGMKEMVEKATVPAVCIGGISMQRLQDVLKAGAKNFCMVRPVCEANSPDKIVKEILKVYNDYKNL